VDDQQLSAQSRRVTRFHQRRGPKINIAHVSEDTDRGKNERAEKANDNNPHMGAAIGAVH
jgi:hypothetical protein